MKTEYIISAVLIVLVVISVIQIFQISSLKNAISGSAVGISSGIDTAGWTEDEKMNYEMHGIIPARVGGSSSSPGSEMVGGC